MRPISSASPSSSSATAGIRVWKSPIPYLFGGLALMLALISFALVILICSYRRRASQSSSASASSDEQDMKQLAMPKITQEIDSEPKILVIMAGGDMPTYLAKPITRNSSSSTCYCTCGAEAAEKAEAASPSSSGSTSEQILTN
ncbi:hypothetical protein L6164_006586 [Bauhinia variegata]|uniref:Uncharacterized protein n=1 Tax=Bauhinia variegata TaxID=167791 RepID=A0ACB9PWY6_BAUVA|nr:hypothetical protein L6164_006586 [Bauhinia variegata]